MRHVIVGGDAAGMTAASRIRGAAPDDEIVVFEAGRFTSYSACGIPFVVGGIVSGGVEALVARSPEEHRRRGIDVRTNHEVTEIDVARGEVEILDRHGGGSSRVGYDRLLIATGGEPIRPDLPGIGLPMVHGVQTLEDADRLFRLAEEACRRVVVVGGGYIGLEMAEAYVHRGCTATVVERADQPLGLFDADLGQRAADAMTAHGVEFRGGVTVEGFEPGKVLTSDGELEADLVVLGIGTRPRSGLAAAAGIQLGANDAVHVDDHQATTTDGVWSAGDCAESRHLVTGQPVHIPLGTYANRHGRVAGLNMAGGDAVSPAVLGTAITKLCELELALTGLTEHRAREAGFDAVAVTIDTTTRAGYLPDAGKMIVRLTVERGSGRLLGAQIVGGPGAAKRIDTLATAITAGMTVAEVADLDLAYAPPFSSVWDPVAVAAREAIKAI
jgi:NADPH-dependent 2,4-dienoyl-CoA reductase/sulfur reductase-like enzyme